MKDKITTGLFAFLAVIIFVTMFLCLPGVAKAGQFGIKSLPDNYFRLADVSHLQPVAGALVAPDLSDSEGTGLVPLVTHSPKDGCLLPGIVCEDWSPMAIGASLNAGKVSFVLAPLANILPWMQAGVLAMLPASWASTRAMINPDPTQRVTFSAGPALEYKQLTNKGYYRTFVGLALHF